MYLSDRLEKRRCEKNTESAQREAMMKALEISLCMAALGIVLFSSCEENQQEEDILKQYLQIYSGNYQSERAGAQLADPLVVRVRNILNDPQEGVTVNFFTDVSDAVVTPAIATTDENGMASCYYTLGSGEGTQRVQAAIAQDTVVFTEYSEAIACSEESPQELCSWPTRHIFIATTGSTLLSGAGTVIIDYNPESRTIAKVLETNDLLDGISFSSRGELFVSTPGAIKKVDPLTHELMPYINYSGGQPLSLDPNPGGVLAALSQNGPMKIGCPPSEISLLLPPGSFANILWKNIAVDPVKRDFHFVTKNSSISYTLWRLPWDGRSPAESQEVLAVMNVGASEAAGMCIDSSGTVFVVFDGNDNFRRIVSVESKGEIDYSFFDFYARAGGNNIEAGRWGDIAYLDGKLYLIDKRNDRLVTISREGTWLDEHSNTAFSRPLDESEHYAIAASPDWLCLGGKKQR